MNISNIHDQNETTSVTYSRENIVKTTHKSFNEDAVSFSVNGNSDGQFLNCDDNKNIQEIVDISDSKNKKDYMVLMSNTLSKQDYKELKEEGFDPAAMDPEETVNIVDKIKATMAESGQIIAGYNDDLDLELLTQITGSATAANALLKSFIDNNIPITIDNAKDTINTKEMSDTLMPLDTAAINFMVRNNMEPTISNIYLAEHSGESSQTKIAGIYIDKNGYQNGSSGEISNLDALNGQIEKIINDAGFENTKENIDSAKQMIKDGLSLTPDSFELYKRLTDIKLPLSEAELLNKIGIAISDGKRPQDATVDKDKSYLEEAKELVKAVNEISDETVSFVAESDKELNLKNLIAAKDNNVIINSSEKSIKAMRIMTEVRISMTVSSTYFLMKNNINVDTRELSKLVDDLKEAENRQFESIFGKDKSSEELNEMNDIFSEAVAKRSELKGLPLASLGAVAVKSSITLNVVYSEAKVFEERYLKAGERYETMATEIRPDLGDSISKAFRNTEDILKSMGLDNSEENQKAIRILGYNSMEITDESVDNVKNLVNKIQNVIDKMTPAKTLSLIREGVNPLTVSLDELNEKLNKYDVIQNEPKRFSEYLVDMENSISPDERESYIGIYRLINQIEKNDMAVAGSLMNAGAEINFKNLLSFVRTRKAKGIDITMDKEFGSLENVIEKGVSISEQIEKAFIKVSDINGNNASLNDQTLDYIKEAALANEEIIDSLVNSGIKVTPENINSMNGLMKRKGLNNLKEKLEKHDALKDSVPEFLSIIKEPLENFTDKENAENAFNEMTERVKELINRQATNISDTIDLKEMSFSLNQIFLSQKLSRDEYYELPIQINDELTTVSVRVRRGQEKRVDIAFENEKYGRVNGYFEHFDESLKGTFFCESNELQGLENSLMGSYKKSSLSVTSITFINSNTVNTNILKESPDKYSMEDTSQGREANKSMDAISTKNLYQVAKIFIEVLGAN